MVNGFDAVTKVITDDYLSLQVACIQTMAESRWNGRIGQVLELGEPQFHAVITALWNAIATLERFYRIVTETENVTEIAFWIFNR